MITLKDLIALSFKVQVSHYEDKHCIEYPLMYFSYLLMSTFINFKAVLFSWI